MSMGLKSITLMRRLDSNAKADSCNDIVILKHDIRSESARRITEVLCNIPSEYTDESTSSPL
jgi:hypothetical protein